MEVSLEYSDGYFRHGMLRHHKKKEKKNTVLPFENSSTMTVLKNLLENKPRK